MEVGGIVDGSLAQAVERLSRLMGSPHLDWDHEVVLQKLERHYVELRRKQVVSKVRSDRLYHRQKEIEWIKAESALLECQAKLRRHLTGR